MAQAARRAGLRFGSAARVTTLDEPDLRALLLRECDTITPELEMKWAALAPVPDVRSYDGADRLVKFALASGKRVRGHTLLWHASVPEWATARVVGKGGWDIVAAHIAETVGRYRRAVDEWDVVNEPLDPGARDDGLRDSIFLRAFGPDYIERALRAAHAADPRARLAINEYGLEYDRPDQQARRDALLALARRLIERCAPLHVIGIQAHLDPANGDIATDALRRFVGALADLGLGVAVTELDVKERDLILPASERDRVVAEHVNQFLDAVLVGRRVRSVSCWGLSDRQSWLQITPQDRARFPGAWADGSDPGVNRGLPFDAAGAPKAMCAVLRTAFAKAAER